MTKRYETVTALAERLRVSRNTVHLWQQAAKKRPSAMPAWETDEVGRRYWTEEAVVEWLDKRPKVMIDHDRPA